MAMTPAMAAWAVAQQHVQSTAVHVIAKQTKFEINLKIGTTRIRHLPPFNLLRIKTLCNFDHFLTSRLEELSENLPALSSP
jgi:hypothetical protein